MASLPHAVGDRQTHQNKTGKHVSLLIFFVVIQVNPLHPDAPCFIILLCLTPDDLLIKGRALVLNGLTGLSAHVSS